MMKSATSTIRYFAYGSQCNVEGVKKRGIHPISSVPAMLPGYKLHFKLMGMGIVEKEDGAETHGVLHELNDADWKRMCEIEGGYAPSELEVFPYNGTPTTAYVFTVGDQMVLTEDSKPTDRYIHVIAKGLEEMGAKREYIEWLKSVPCEQTARPGSYPTAEQLLQVKMDSLPMVDHEFFTQDIGERSVRADWMGIVVDIRDIPEAFLEIMSKARGRSWCEFYEEHKGVLNNPFLPDPTCGGEIFLDHHLFLLNEFHSFLSKMGIEIKPVGRLDISKSKWTALRSYLDVREMQPAN